jgi:cell division protein FtsW
VIIYIADWLSERREEIREWAFGIIPYSILMGIVCGLIIMQRDYSTAVLILMVASAMFFVAGAQLQQMLVAGSVAGLVLLGFLLSEQYRVQRVRTFLNPEADPYNAGYQSLQAIGSFQSGGMAGVGLGRGQIKHAFPMGTAHTDAIYAVIAEETGALGCLLLIVLFGFLAWRGLKIAAGSPDRFSGLLATGITAWLTFQALINMAVVARLMPFTGIPMPFVSFGGSSLVTCMAGVGLLANISRRSQPAEARIYAPLDLRRRNRRARLSRVHRARRAGRRG